MSIPASRASRQSSSPVPITSPHARKSVQIGVENGLKNRLWRLFREPPFDFPMRAFPSDLGVQRGGFEHFSITERERRLRFGPRVTLPLLFLFSFFSFHQDRTGRMFAAAGAVGMCVNGHACGTVGNDVCGLWESRRLFHRAVNICFPSAEQPFSTFP